MFRRPIRSLSAVILLSAGALLAQVSVARYLVKLNGPLPYARFSEVRDPRFTPDGSRVVYQADLEVDGRFDVFLSPSDGSGGAERLTLPPVNNEFVAVESFRISPDGQWLVYAADTNSDIIYGPVPYAVRLDGSQPAVRLDFPFRWQIYYPPLVYLITPDSQRVVCRALSTPGGLHELFSMPIDGSQPAARLNGTLVNLGEVLTDFALSSDGTRVVYVADEQENSRFELFSAPIDGATPAVKLNPTPVTGGDLGGGVGGKRFQISPDGTRVVYRADQLTNDVAELFSVPIDGSASATRLNPTLVAGGDVTGEYRIDPTGARVVYMADQETDGRMELYSVPLAGGPALKLNAPLPVGAQLGLAFDISPDGSKVAYVTDQNVAGALELLVVPIDASAAPLVLSLPATALLEPRFSPDGARVLFRAAAGAGLELYSVLANGSQAQVGLNAPLPGYASVSSGVDFDPASGRVLYRANLDASASVELYSAPLDGSSPAAKLNQPLGPAGEVAAFVLAPTGRVAYLDDEPLPGTIELFAAPSDGAAPAVRVNDALPLGTKRGSVRGFELTPDGSTTVFQADQDYTTVIGLYAVPTASGAPRLLNDPSDEVVQFQLDSAGEHAFYSTADGFRLFRRVLDGSEPATLLAQATPGSGLAFDVTSNGQHVVYLELIETSPSVFVGTGLFGVPADGSTGAVSLATGQVLANFRATSQRAVFLRRAGTQDRLWSVPLDGSSAPVELTAPLAADRTVLSFRLVPGATQVLYWADQDIDNRYDLYVVPLDGSATPLRLNDPGCFSCGVTVYAPSRDGSRALFVVYTGIAELYSVPLDRSTPAVKLSGPMTPFGTVTSFVLSPDGEHVAYVADQETNETFELYSAPIATAGSAVKLSSLLRPGGDVLSMSISPDGAHVVYLADPIDGRVELFRAPIAGGGAVRLSGALVPGGDVTRFLIAPDSESVAYLADQLVDERFELFRVSITPTLPPELASGALVEGGDVGVPNLPSVTSFLFTPDGDTLLFVADKEIDGSGELYASSPRLIRQATPP